MPRRYGADGTRLWNGKTPEEFTEADAYRFMAETEAVLQRKELMDDPAQPAPASGKEEFYLSKKDDVLLTPEQIAAEERRWLFDAPIAELAEVKGVSIDEAVKLRTDAVLQEAGRTSAEAESGVRSNPRRSDRSPEGSKSGRSNSGQERHVHAPDRFLCGRIPPYLTMTALTSRTFETSLIRSRSASR